MFAKTKTLFAATLVLAAASLTFVADASAAPTQATRHEVRLLPHDMADTSLCPAGYSVQECFYNG